MITVEDETFLRRALRLAMNGRGHVEPNPMVGCVLVKSGQIIGEGWHAKVGKAHAEPNALADCAARGNSPEGATAYVTLEPCCHTNKRTPPCAPRLIAAKVARVVIGCLDPNPDVNGQGVAMLREAGIVVDALPEPTTTENAHGWPSVGVRALDASVFRQLIAAFAGRQQHEIYFNTYMTLKWAESADGRVAGENGARTQISNATSSALVHQLRARSTAIIVGINTVLTDDPMLNVRGIEVERQPNRVVLDRDLRLPVTTKLVTSIKERGAGYVIALCSERTYRDSPRVEELKALGVQVDRLDDLPLKTAIEVNAVWHMGSAQRREALVECGPTLARAFLPDADRLWVFRSPNKIQGGPSAPRAAAIPDHYVATGTLNLAGDTLTEYLNTRSPAFFAAVPSADLVLAAEAAGAAIE